MRNDKVIIGKSVALIDLVERHEDYDYFSAKIFYNCTSTWFSDYCQYTFGQSNGRASHLVCSYLYE
jgi:hypothetical protein